jgi:hypothetical protein
VRSAAVFVSIGRIQTRRVTVSNLLPQGREFETGIQAPEPGADRPQNRLC